MSQGRRPVRSAISPTGSTPAKTQLSMGSLFNFSFFITQNMKTQLREGPVYGALPILYVFLARTGKTIHESRFRKPG